MKNVKRIVLAALIIASGTLLSACENTHVSGSVSYGVGYGYGYGGYPMYYGSGYRNHTNIIVNRPPAHTRPRPSTRPATRPRVR
jgi:hypothetical protein